MFGSTFYDFLEGPWDHAKGYLREHLEQLSISLNAQWARAFNSDQTLTEFAIGNPGANVPSYVANTGPNRSPRWEKVDVAQGVKSRLRYVNFTAATAASRLLGRRSTSAGDWEEISLGEGLTMTGSELSAQGGLANHFFLMGG